MMSQRRHAGRIGLLRAYGMALGFALGQVGSFVPGSVRPRPSIVRDMEDESAADGFHSLERIDARTILTVPLDRLAHVPDARQPPRSGRFDLN